MGIKELTDALDELRDTISKAIWTARLQGLLLGLAIGALLVWAWMR